MSDRILFSPFHLGPLTLRNRIVMAPMTRARAGAERLANSLMAEYYAQRASAGLIVTEGTNISEQSLGWPNTPGIWTTEQRDAWKPVTAAVHAQGGLIFCQLWHSGRASHSSFRADGSLPVAPSPIKLGGDYIHTPQGKQPYETPRSLETGEIPGVVDEYRRAAEHARQAGFDGIELHGANGYLIDTFLQSKTNHRSDRYGGSFENRFRFLGEILDAVTQVLPANRVAVRLGPNGVYNDTGSADNHAMFLYAAKRLDHYGLAYLHLVDGLAFGYHQLCPPVTLREVREYFHGPLMGNCGYDATSATTTLADGDADLISFGRAFISNPDLVARFAHGWPLAEANDMSIWYSPGPQGYTDFPLYSPTQMAIVD